MIPRHFLTGDIVRSLSPVPELPNYKYQLRVGEFEAWVSFNLEWPIDIQLKRAKQWLDEYKSSLKKDCGIELIENRNQIKKFPYYIRLLDAEVKTMAACLLPDQENDYPEYSASKNIGRV